MAYEQDDAGQKCKRVTPSESFLRGFGASFRAVRTGVYLSTYALRIGRQLDGLAARLRDPRFDFLFRPGKWSPRLDGKTEEDLDTLLTDWLGGPSPSQSSICPECPRAFSITWSARCYA